MVLHRSVSFLVGCGEILFFKCGALLFTPTLCFRFVLFWFCYSNNKTKNRASNAARIMKHQCRAGAFGPEICSPLFFCIRLVYEATGKNINRQDKRSQSVRSPRNFCEEDQVAAKVKISIRYWSQSRSQTLTFTNEQFWLRLHALCAIRITHCWGRYFFFHVYNINDDVIPFGRYFVRRGAGGGSFHKVRNGWRCLRVSYVLKIPVSLPNARRAHMILELNGYEITKHHTVKI